MKRYNETRGIGTVCVASTDTDDSQAEEPVQVGLGDVQAYYK